VEIIIRRRIEVDDEIADEIRWLNVQGVITEGSCSGHGKMSPSAVIRPSSRDRAVELGYDPVYDESTQFFTMELQGESFDCHFLVDTENGRTALCQEVIRQPYADCVFSSGLVKEFYPDTVYLRIDKDSYSQPLTIFLRPDEMQAIAWLCNGALWSHWIVGKENDDNQSLASSTQTTTTTQAGKAKGDSEE
jgi:hypothetical protein